MLQITAGSAFAGCKPSHPRPTIILKETGTKDTGAKEFGACGFDPQTMSYRGEPVEQAKCLMRSMDATRNLAPMLEGLPSALASRVGQDGGLPTREALSTLLSKQDLEWEFAYFLWQPIARANDNDPAAPMARYFVIHDTSGPNFGHHAFPDDINVNPKINNLENFKCDDGWGRAHIVISRSGGMLVNHDYGIPWRETKFERAVNFNGALKGLFVHNELIQPRRAASGHGRYNDAQTPDPGFTGAQYDRLALALHHRQRAVRPLADPGVSCRDRRRHSQRPRRSVEFQHRELRRQPAAADRSAQWRRGQRGGDAGAGAGSGSAARGRSQGARRRSHSCRGCAERPGAEAGRLLSSGRRGADRGNQAAGRTDGCERRKRQCRGPGRARTGCRHGRRGRRQARGQARADGGSKPPDHDRN